MPPCTSPPPPTTHAFPPWRQLISSYPSASKDQVEQANRTSTPEAKVTVLTSATVSKAANESTEDVARAAPHGETFARVDGVETGLLSSDRTRPAVDSNDRDNGSLGDQMDIEQAGPGSSAAWQQNKRDNIQQDSAVIANDQAARAAQPKGSQTGARSGEADITASSPFLPQTAGPPPRTSNGSASSSWAPYTPGPAGSTSFPSVASSGYSSYSPDPASALSTRPASTLQSECYDSRTTEVHPSASFATPYPYQPYFRSDASTSSSRSAYSSGFTGSTSLQRSNDYAQGYGPVATFGSPFPPRAQHAGSSPSPPPWRASVPAHAPPQYTSASSSTSKGRTSVGSQLAFDERGRPIPTTRAPDASSSRHAGSPSGNGVFPSKPSPLFQPPGKLRGEGPTSRAPSSDSHRSSSSRPPRSASKSSDTVLVIARQSSPRDKMRATGGRSVETARENVAQYLEHYEAEGRTAATKVPSWAGKITAETDFEAYIIVGNATKRADAWWLPLDMPLGERNSDRLLDRLPQVDKIVILGADGLSTNLDTLRYDFLPLLGDDAEIAITTAAGTGRVLLIKAADLKRELSTLARDGALAITCPVAIRDWLAYLDTGTKRRKAISAAAKNNAGELHRVANLPAALQKAGKTQVNPRKRRGKRLGEMPARFPHYHRCGRNGCNYVGNASNVKTHRETLDALCYGRCSQGCLGITGGVAGLRHHYQQRHPNITICRRKTCLMTFEPRESKLIPQIEKTHAKAHQRGSTRPDGLVGGRSAKGWMTVARAATRPILFEEPDSWWPNRAGETEGSLEDLDEMGRRLDGNDTSSEDEDELVEEDEEGSDDEEEQAESEDGDEEEEE